MGVVVAAIAWWGPIAIAGGAIAGLAAGYLLLTFAGAPRSGGRVAERIRFERTDQTNYPRPNPAAFVVLFVVVALVVGLAIGLSVD